MTATIPAAPSPARGQSRPALYGRLQERWTIETLLAAARAGQSGVLVLSGEPGVGKSALLEHACGRADGFRIVTVTGALAERDLAFAALHRLCAPLLDNLSELPAPQREALGVALAMSSGPPPDRFLVALAVLGLLSHAAAERPLLCVVDDADWLDAPSAHVLGFVARRLAADSVVLLIARPRAVEVPGFDGLPELALEGLESGDARALLQSVLPGPLDEHVRDRILAETRGNPLALLEAVRGIHMGDLAGGFGLPDTLAVPAWIEDEYRRRSAALPEPSRQLLVLAAADGVGDPALVRQAALALGISEDAFGPAQAGGLLEIATHVRFRHPLVRSAVYGSASPAQRRLVHAALADATDQGADPDRRCWHRAHATERPDEDLAGELVGCAARARRRGGAAAAAAFLERAVHFTPDPLLRAARAVAAAEAKLASGDDRAAESLLDHAANGPVDEHARAKLDLARARLAVHRGSGAQAPALLVSAARRLERRDDELARRAHVEALTAALFAGGPDGFDAGAVARAARASSAVATDPRRARRLVALGLAARLADGSVQAAPHLAEALGAALRDPGALDHVSAAPVLVAMELWDDTAWLTLAARQVDIARDIGVLARLPMALDLLGRYHAEAGRLSLVDRLLAEAEAVRTGPGRFPALPLLVAALRGRADAATSLHGQLVDADVEGAAMAAADRALALLHNGLGQHGRALAPARRAVQADRIAISSLALCELVEAAARCARHDIAREAAENLAARTGSSDTAWSRGVVAHARALVAGDEGAEALHREALDALGRCDLTVHLARAHLTYGEWLRRHDRVEDARRELRRAHEVFDGMGACGFADRARRELLATGERVRGSSEEGHDTLTRQEEHIARLARKGRTNTEIGAQLFLSPRTVEWHLGKVFAKLGIRSRRDLADALPDRP